MRQSWWALQIGFRLGKKSHTADDGGGEGAGGNAGSDDGAAGHKGSRALDEHRHRGCSRFWREVGRFGVDGMLSRDL
jgi:hypothetical protein